MDTVSLVARILHKSKAHLQSMLMSRNGSLAEDFFGQLVCISFSINSLGETLVENIALLCCAVDNIQSYYTKTSVASNRLLALTIMDCAGLDQK